MTNSCAVYIKDKHLEDLELKFDRKIKNKLHILPLMVGTEGEYVDLDTMESLVFDDQQISSQNEKLTSEYKEFYRLHFMACGCEACEKYYKESKNA